MTLACFLFFFFNDTATTEIYTLSLHDALPILGVAAALGFHVLVNVAMVIGYMPVTGIPLPLMSYGGSDRESTRLKSRHPVISYARFCLKKKKTGVGDDVARAGGDRGPGQ